MKEHKAPVLALHTNDRLVKNCSTCAHSHGDINYLKCYLTGTYCGVQRKHPLGACNERLSGWTPIPKKPPRRSLRQWVYDTFWRLA